MLALMLACFALKPLPNSAASITCDGSWSFLLVDNDCDEVGVRDDGAGEADPDVLEALALVLCGFLADGTWRWATFILRRAPTALGGSSTECEVCVQTFALRLSVSLMVSQWVEDPHESWTVCTIPLSLARLASMHDS